MTVLALDETSKFNQIDLTEVDHALMGQLLREALAGRPPALAPDAPRVASIADVCGGGGHSAAFLAQVAAFDFGMGFAMPAPRLKSFSVDMLAR